MAAEDVVVVQLKARFSHEDVAVVVILSHNAQHLATHRAIRVHASRILAVVHARQLLLGQFRLDGIGHIGVDPLGHIRKDTVDLERTYVVARRSTQVFRKNLCRTVGLVDFFGVADDGGAILARCQHVAIAVVYSAASCL